MLNLGVEVCLSSLALVLVSVETLDSERTVPPRRDSPLILPWSRDDELLGAMTIGDEE
jgi:hypothetical protein